MRSARATCATGHAVGTPPKKVPAFHGRLRQGCFTIWLDASTVLVRRLGLDPCHFQAGRLDKSKGVITASYVKDPNDPRWKDDPGYMEFVAFVTKYMSAEQLNDPAVLYGYGAAMPMTHVLKQCAKTCREKTSSTRRRTSKTSMGLPGTRINTSPDNYFPIRQM
jgi:hypothetical protein